MTRRKKKPATKVVVNNKNNHPLLGVRNSSSIPMAQLKPRKKSLFVSRFDPSVQAETIKTSLIEQIKLESLECVRLKTKKQGYASFHISVKEEEFPLLNNSTVWSTGCLILPFYGRLSNELIYSPDCPLIVAPNQRNGPTTS